MPERDERGRFVAGNTTSANGGRARAARLTKAELATIARSGLEAVARELGVSPEDAARILSERGIAALRRKWAAAADAAERTPSQGAETP
jgi:hypothetical protein